MPRHTLRVMPVGYRRRLDLLAVLLTPETPSPSCGEPLSWPFSPRRGSRSLVGHSRRPRPRCTAAQTGCCLAGARGGDPVGRLVPHKLIREGDRFYECVVRPIGGWGCATLPATGLEIPGVVPDLARTPGCTARAATEAPRGHSRRGTPTAPTHRARACGCA